MSASPTATRSRFAPSIPAEPPSQALRAREPAGSWQTSDGEALFGELQPLLHAAFLGAKKPPAPQQQQGQQQKQDMYLLEQQEKQHQEERRKALEQLAQLTLWQQGNQRELARLGVPALVMQLVRKLTEPPAPPPSGSGTAGAKGSTGSTGGGSSSSSGTPQASKFASVSDANLAACLSALTLLLNLAGNEDLTPTCVAALAPISGLAVLARLTDHPHRDVVALATRVLINLTHSSAEGRTAAAKAGVLKVAERLFQTKEADYAQCKLGCWLLANLTRGLEDSGPHRQALLAQRDVAKRAVALVHDYKHTPVSVLLLACRLLTNLAREGSEAQTLLGQLGAVDAVATLVEATGLSAEVYATAVPALSALALDHPGTTQALAQRRHLPVALGLLLESRTDPLASSNEDARLVLAVHTLVHVLGHMLSNGGQGLPPTPAPAPAPAAAPGKAAATAAAPPPRASQPGAVAVQVVEDGDGDLIEGLAKLSLLVRPQTSGGQAAAATQQPQPSASATVSLSGGPVSSSATKPVVYLSLSAAAQAVGVCLPLSTAVAGKHGEPALSDEQAAEIRHRASTVLLQRLRSNNAAVAGSAAACLYHLLVATPGSAAARETRALLADAALLRQLVAVLASGDAELVHASLSVLDVLCSEPAAVGALRPAGVPWLAAVQKVLWHQDALVRRAAERVLCAAYHTHNSLGI